jgi:hypothetical protein
VCCLQIQAMAAQYRVRRLEERKKKYTRGTLRTQFDLPGGGAFSAVAESENILHAKTSCYLSVAFVHGARYGWRHPYRTPALRPAPRPLSPGFGYRIYGAMHSDTVKIGFHGVKLYNGGWLSSRIICLWIAIGRPTGNIRAEYEVGSLGVQRAGFWRGRLGHLGINTGLSRCR